MLVRDPREAVASLCLLHAGLKDSFAFWPTFMDNDPFRIDIYLRRYIAYYNYVRTDRAAVIIPTSQVFDAPSHLIWAISQEIAVSPQENVTSLVCDYKQKKRQQAANRPLTMFVPNEEKRRNKTRIIRLIEKNKNSVEATKSYHSMLLRAAG